MRTQQPPPHPPPPPNARSGDEGGSVTAGITPMNVISSGSVSRREGGEKDADPVKVKYLRLLGRSLSDKDGPV